MTWYFISDLVGSAYIVFLWSEENFYVNIKGLQIKKLYSDLWTKKLLQKQLIKFDIQITI